MPAAPPGLAARRCAVAVSSTLAACGLGPAPDPSRGYSVGTAPWHDLGAAQVCLGDQALGAPEIQPGGLCVSIDAPPPARCAADADCRSREACVCGACTVAYCASASDCSAPRSCHFSQHRCDLPCTVSPQCGDAEECVAGVCRGRCATTADCQYGEVCNSASTCVTDDCSDPSGCLAGERCELQRVPRQIVEPAPLMVDGRIVLYLDIALPAQLDQRAIWRAVARDAEALRFAIDPSRPVIDNARAPSAVLDADTTYLYFEQDDGAELRVARAPDGVTFGAPVTVLPGPGVHAPSAVHANDTVYLYYARAGAIGLATGRRQQRLTDQGTVLAPSAVEVGDGTPGTAFWTPISELASPHAIVTGPETATVELWFAGFGRESPPGVKFGEPVVIPPNFSIGFAAAELADPGGLAAWPYGPVADRVEALLDHHDELGPAGIDAGGGRFRMYYVDATHDLAPPFALGRLRVLGSGRK